MAFLGIIGMAVSALCLVGLLISFITKKSKKRWLLGILIDTIAFVYALCATGTSNKSHHNNSAVSGEETETVPLTEQETIVKAFKACSVNNPAISAIQSGDGTYSVTMAYPQDYTRYDDYRVCAGDASSVTASFEDYHPELVNLISGVTFAFETSVGDIFSTVLDPYSFTEGDAVNISGGSGKYYATYEDMRAGYDDLRASDYLYQKERYADNARNRFINALMENYSYTSNEASAAYELLSRVGCYDIELLEGRMTEGTSLDAMRGMVNGHQVNFTADNHVVFYIQITDFTETEYGWYVNWRDKLRYGKYESRLAFDLYDGDTDGFLAYYNQSNDSVIPWSEHIG